MTIRERIVLRWLGVKVSDDGLRWTAPRKHHKIIEKSFLRARDDAWRKGIDARLSYLPRGEMSLVLPDRTLTLRWLEEVRRP